MIAFRVRLNREEVTTAGLTGKHVVTVVVDSAERDIERGSTQRLHVGGLRKLPDGSQTHVSWFDSPLQVGDTLTVDVVESAEADIPRPRETTSAEVVERGEKELLRNLLKKYGPPG